MIRHIFPLVFLSFCFANQDGTIDQSRTLLRGSVIKYESIVEAPEKESRLPLREESAVDEVRLLHRAPSRSQMVVGDTSLTNLIQNQTETYATTQSHRRTAVTLPTGPFITSTTANEVVIFPQSPVPITSSRTKCPHLDSGLLDWHSKSTWGGSIPISGKVTIPVNSRVIIRRAINQRLSIVTIPSSSELIFGENATGIAFHTSGMLVQGKLTIGSETCPMSTPVTITLYGIRPDDAVTNVPSPEYKGIAVTGKISIHGEQFYRSWTRLALTVNPGDSVVMLQHDVNWEPGQSIVLVTTAMKDSREWHRNEVAVVMNVVHNPRSGVGAAVFLRKPVRYQHLANKGYQGEVGLLTRRIKIQGDLSSEPTDPDPLNCTSSTSRYGDRAIPCPNKALTGYGGHIIVRQGGKGYIEGVELYRMGQTNVEGRYPIHFHLLGSGCSDCYFRHSSVHRSFYRCISIHGTNFIRVQENVGFDVSGFCYYLEDGTEQNNRIEFNLGAHIHMIGPGPPKALTQSTVTYQQSNNLFNPADVAAAAFYVSNIHNYVIGNAASGGWAGFAFPVLDTPILSNRHVNLRPASVLELTINGNSAHSTGWWWKSASAFYFGGSLYYNDQNVLEYQAGRDFVRQRDPCFVNKCLSKAGCNSYCREWEQAWVKVSNSKAFLTPGAGLLSWAGRMDVVGYECHDCGLSMHSLSTDGFSVRNMLTVCRTQTPIELPSSASASKIPADGFTWYDNSQEHILYNVTFRNCGYRSQKYNQYDKGLTRGCGDEVDIGCNTNSSVWTFLTHSDTKIPEVMQATRAVKFQNCGRRFRQHDFRQSRGVYPVSNAARLQSWYDADGSVTGLNEPSIIASGQASAGKWWQVDDEVVFDAQGPLWFYKRNSGPQRGLGSFSITWDSALDLATGITQCGNGNILPCNYLGSIKHLGNKFENDTGLPITANADIVGPVGGFGWKLQLNEGAPKSFRVSEIEVDPATPLLLSVAYPPGTSFNITLSTTRCTPSAQYTCSAVFRKVNSVAAVRRSLGNTYYVNALGVLTIRVIQTAKTFIGRPEFFLPQYSDVGRDGKGVALERYERGGIRLPRYTNLPFLEVHSNCPSNGAYCSQKPVPYKPSVCSKGFVQTAYDTCSKMVNGKLTKVFADGSSKTVSV